MHVHNSEQLFFFVAILFFVFLSPSMNESITYMKYSLPCSMYSDLTETLGSYQGKIKTYHLSLAFLFFLPIHELSKSITTNRNCMIKFSNFEEEWI